MKFEHIVVYENNSNKFDYVHCWIMVNLTVGLKKFFPFTAKLAVRSFNSTSVQASSSVYNIQNI